MGRWQSMRAAPLLAAWMASCGAGNLQATLELDASGEHLPCTGMRRLRVTMFYDEQNGRGRDSFGKFYADSGDCDLPAGLPLQIDQLPITDRMWIMVEGFDSTTRRRLCRTQSGVFTRSEVESGQLAALTLQREPVDGKFPTASVVIEQLEGLSALEPIDALEFSINFGMPSSISGSFYREAGKQFSQMTLVISSLHPDTGKKILLTALRGGQRLAQWQQLNFDIPEGELFVTLQPGKL